MFSCVFYNAPVLFLCVYWRFLVWSLFVLPCLDLVSNRCLLSVSYFGPEAQAINFAPILYDVEKTGEHQEQQENKEQHRKNIGNNKDKKEHHRNNTEKNPRKQKTTQNKLGVLGKTGKHGGARKTRKHRTDRMAQEKINAF